MNTQQQLDPMCILRAFEDAEAWRYARELPEPPGFQMREVEDAARSIGQHRPLRSTEIGRRMITITTAVLVLHVVREHAGLRRKELAHLARNKYERVIRFFWGRRRLTYLELLRHLARTGDVPDERGLIQIRLRRCIAETFDRLTGFIADQYIIEGLKRDHRTECEAYAGAEGDTALYPLLRHLLPPIEPEHLAAMTPEQLHFVTDRNREGAEHLAQYLKLVNPLLESGQARTCGEAEGLLRRRMLQ